MAEPSTQPTVDYEIEEKDPNVGMWVIVGIVGLIIGAFIFLRTTPSEVGSGDDLAAMLTNGQPKVIEFYSNFWTTCLLNKPIVDGLEEDLTGKAAVLRLDVLSTVGRQAAATYGVRGTPTLIVVDGQGQAVLTQVSLVRPGPVKSQVEALLASAN